jgi:hypothetical protein
VALTGSGSPRGGPLSLERDDPPWVLFVCQDDEHRDRFLAAADHELTGRLWHPSAATDQRHYPGRRRMLFATEADAHAGVLQARRVPATRPATQPDAV